MIRSNTLHQADLAKNPSSRLCSTFVKKKMTRYAKWLFDGPHYTFLSNLKLDSCIGRLNENIDKPSNRSVNPRFGSSDFVGQVFDNRFSFHSKCFNKGSKPIFEGRLIEVKTGTIIEGCFQTDSFVKAFSMVFISILVLFLLLFLSGLLADLKNDPALVISISLIVLILIGISAFIILGKAAKISDEETYTNFLVQLLEAKLIERKE